MEQKYNKTLKKLTDTSAVTHSVVPVLICDENLLVCTKSIGIDRLLGRMPLKRSIADRFSDETIERIKDPNVSVFCTSFAHENLTLPAVITKGTVSDQPYVAAILDPKFIFTPFLPDKYRDESCLAIADSLNTLLNTAEDATSAFKNRCLQLSRLCAICGSYAAPKSVPLSNAVNVPGFIDLFISSLETAMPLLGMSIRRSGVCDMPLSTNVPPRLFQMTFSTLLMSALSLSADGNIELCCVHQKENGEAEISFAASISDTLAARISESEDIVNSTVPLRLELAALKDAAPAHGIGIGFRADSGRITFFCRVPVSCEYIADMHSPDSIISAELVQMLRDMYEFITAQ